MNSECYKNDSKLKGYKLVSNYETILYSIIIENIVHNLKLIE